jgi:hypothetical protein
MELGLGVEKIRDVPSRVPRRVYSLHI